jgi:hydroxymethylpyrimidine pyrophosphatase-like HAD family hydrolase
MTIRALATDYDGTIATDGEVPASVVGALERFRASGRAILLVTGRRLPSLRDAFPDFEMFDAVVAENGALLYRPATREESSLAPPPPAAFLAALARRGVKPELGRTIVAAEAARAPDLAAAIVEAGTAWRVILNKDSAMCLPTSVDKASGLECALGSMGLAAADVVGVGDAENDLDFLAQCGVAAAVANALPDVKAAADVVTEGEAGAGVIWLIDRILAGEAFPSRRMRAGASG